MLQVTRQLARYGLRSKTIRFGYDTEKGFEISQFADAFARYLSVPGDSQSQSNNSSKANEDATIDVTEVPVTSNASVTRTPSAHAGCYLLPMKRGGMEVCPILSCTLYTTDLGWIAVNGRAARSR